MVTDMVSLIEHQLTKKQWSPEQIAGILAANGASVSHTTIYRHIRRDRIAGGQLYKNLRHRGKKYNYKSGKKAGRGCIPNRIDISERPKVVEDKIRLGDWEGDTIVGANHKGAIVTLVDRKSKFALLAFVPNAAQIR
jgi:IS30 family transposase